MADSKSEDDIFVKEVEEEIKQENLLNLWKRFGKIIIGVNFISEQILGDNEESVVKNKDTWVFEKPEGSSGPAWTLIST